ncbi:MAG: hypothetical protein H6719_18330 [Sandaracinaceae bacterium]|nr:hypothetical protein [Sandaracinaceae bacterium]
MRDDFHPSWFQWRSEPEWSLPESAWAEVLHAATPALRRCFEPHRLSEPPLFFDRYLHMVVRSGMVAEVFLIGRAPPELQQCVHSAFAGRPTVSAGWGMILQGFVYDPTTRRVTPSPVPEPRCRPDPLPPPSPRVVATVRFRWSGHRSSPRVRALRETRIRGRVDEVARGLGRSSPESRGTVELDLDYGEPIGPVPELSWRAGPAALREPMTRRLRGHDAAQDRGGALETVHLTITFRVRAAP